MLRDDFLAEARRQPDIGEPLNRAAEALTNAALGRQGLQSPREVAADLVERARRR
ncbi:MAG TPA: hypothetical protein VEA35_00535 [Ramlibacter sp.]|nr:hypothetical protein [Ramlibacter sp.]